MTPEELITKLIEIGVVDATRCKVLSVREYVNSLLQLGYKKNRRHVESYRNLLLLLRIYPQMHVLLQKRQSLLTIQPACP